MTYRSPVDSVTRQLPPTDRGDPNFPQMWGAREIVVDAAVAQRGTGNLVELYFPYPRTIQIYARWDDLLPTAGIDVLVMLGFPGPRGYAWSGNAVGVNYMVPTAVEGIALFPAPIASSRVTVEAFGNAGTAGRPIVLWAGAVGW